MKSKHFYRQGSSPRQSWSSSFPLPLEVRVQGLAGDAGLRSAQGAPDPSPLSFLDSFVDGFLHREEMAQEKTSG